MPPDPTPAADPADLLPRPEVLLPRLAKAAKDVRLLRGLLRLAREHAPPQAPPARPTAGKEVGRG